MKPTRSAVCIALFLLVGCTGAPDDGTAYHKTYVVGKVPGAADFARLSDHERMLDSMYAASDHEPDSLNAADRSDHREPEAATDFANNRSRLYLTTYVNGRPEAAGADSTRDPALPCLCLLKQDTLLISSGVGFFAGFAVEVKVAGSNFRSGYGFYTDDIQPYKASPADTFTDALEVASRLQDLVLDAAPTYRPGQQLTGYLTFTSHDFYERTAPDRPPDTSCVRGRMTFTCQTKPAVE